MQIASKQCLWTEGINGTVVEVGFSPRKGEETSYADTESSWKGMLRDYPLISIVAIHCC